MSMTLLGRAARDALATVLRPSSHPANDTSLADELLEIFDDRYGTSAERMAIVDAAGRRIALAVAKVLLSEPASEEMLSVSPDSVAPIEGEPERGRMYAAMAASRLAALAKEAEGNG